ncbi:2TM domain-containing protein [Algoriella sp.]|uniref:2TM domain-containing protein n=1 Tax=Algoriella sp. TaxID=1872434 RepID=UPI002FC94B46
MKSPYKILNITFSTIFTVGVLLLVFNQSNVTFIVNSSSELGRITGYLIRFVILGFIIYQFIKGLILSDEKTILRNIVVLLLMNFILYCILFFTSENVSIIDFFKSDAIIYFIGYSIFSFCAGFINTGIFNQYKKEFKIDEKPKYEIWKYFVQAIIYTQLLYFVFVKFVNSLFFKPIFYDNYINYILVGVITIILLFFFYFIEKRRYRLEKKIIIESTKAETATAKFESLKNQLDPHFLFNSLNVLTGLIEENPDNAIDFTTSLSKIYRYVLEQKDKEVVPIQEEINFAKTYINLLKLRFENSIDFETEQTNFSETEFIVPLSLQILLENTIKHNIVSEQKPLKIKMYKQDNNLIVENTLQPKDSIKDSTGVGLNNIINRYQLISNRKVEIEKDQLFRVQLPILTQKTTTMKIENNIDEQQTYQRAIERAKELKKFYSHLGTYIVMNIFFVVLNYFTSYGHWWFYWPMLGWGLAIAMKAMKVYGFGSDWEERKAKEIYEKEQNKKWQ